MWCIQFQFFKDFDTIDCRNFCRPLSKVIVLYRFNKYYRKEKQKREHSKRQEILLFFFFLIFLLFPFEPNEMNGMTGLQLMVKVFRYRNLFYKLCRDSNSRDISIYNKDELYDHLQAKNCF